MPVHPKMAKRRSISKRKMRVCVVTGSRAEYGLLKELLFKIRKHKGLKLQLVVSAGHLLPKLGSTWREIVADGFHIDCCVPMLSRVGTRQSVAQSLAKGVVGFSRAFQRLRPDILMILGDRFEALAAAETALVLGIPIAHISGGDVTAGAFDDAIRHAITKMSHLHFTASSDAANRIIRMGEEPQRVFAVGEPGLDRLRTMKLVDRDTLEADLGFEFRRRNLLVTFHPETLSRISAERQFSVVLKALVGIGDDVGLLFTYANADPGGFAINKMLKRFVATHANASAFASLGRLRYLSIMAQCGAVVGNSSSGLVEAPSLRKPTVNIGDRQKGRLRANSVIDCPLRSGQIERAVRRALNMKIGDIANPYGDGRSSDRIVRVLASTKDPKELLHKTFYDRSPEPR